MRVVHTPRPVPARELPWLDSPAARRGEAGERVVRSLLEAQLDDRFILVHGLFLPGGEGDIDAVLIGPRTCALEIKTYADDRALRVRGLRWEYAVDGVRWKALDSTPSQQAEAHARRVSYALRSAGLPAYNVVPIVVLVGGAPLTLERSRVDVLRPAELLAYLKEGPELPSPAWPDLALRALLVAASAVLERSERAARENSADSP